MPGHFGADDGEDGAFASTTSASKSGAFFRNDATAKAAAPGGSGVFGLTTAAGAAGVFGASNAPGASGVGVQGNGPEAGVSGWSENGNGLRAFSNKGDALYAATQAAGKSAIFGNNESKTAATAPGGSGVFGVTLAPGAAGVFGTNNGPGKSGVGVQGNGPEAGVSGWSKSGNGLRAFSNKGDALYAATQAAGKSAIFGNNESKTAATAPGGSGVFGVTLAPGAAGVFGTNNGPGKSGVGVQGNGPEAGVSGWSESGFGVRAVGRKVGLFAQGGENAAEFVGNVKVAGDLAVTGDVKLVNADCAERFDLAAGALAEPGTVMVIEDGGALRPSLGGYDCRVAGVVSGAGDYRPAMLLDDRDTGRVRPPVALIGKVYCKVDARQEAISFGDLLTTAESEGRAMKASDTARRPGAVIGKALAPLASGVGLIPILVALQ